MNNLSHGEAGKHEVNFVKLLPLRNTSFDTQALAQLAQQMKGDVDTVKDGPDPEENLLVPAGYTYFGQFIDHDLTFDSTSSLDPHNKSAKPTDLRTPIFDLDCLYGDGPDAQPYMYDGAKLLYKNEPTLQGAKDLAGQDLLRNPLGRAIIGDKRNDENSIVSQIQLAFIKYHNAVVDHLKTQDPNSWDRTNKPVDEKVLNNKLFNAARNEVRWTYQKLIIEDFLPRIVAPEALKGLTELDPATRKNNYHLYTEDKRHSLPREFVAAAYRFGHSGVRTGYRLNKELPNRFSIFPASSDPTLTAGSDSLLGFDPITNNQVIDSWARFFPESLPGEIDKKESRDTAADEAPRGGIRLQYAYKIDPTLVDPLGVIPRREVAGEATTQEAVNLIGALPDKVGEPPRPSLALLNLLRGNSYKIESGQAFAKNLIDKNYNFKPIDKSHLVVRKGFKDINGNTVFKFVPIPEKLQDQTPLWFYILAEAQAPLVDKIKELKKSDEFPEDYLLNNNTITEGTSMQLRGVGGRIVAEVFYGVLDSDQNSYIKAASKDWQPILGNESKIILHSLLKFAEPSSI